MVNEYKYGWWSTKIFTTRVPMYQVNVHVVSTTIPKTSLEVPHTFKWYVAKTSTYIMAQRLSKTFNSSNFKKME